MADGYKTTEVTDKREYIIEYAPLFTEEPRFLFNAFWRDFEGYATRGERFAGTADTVGELVIYMRLHYPGARLAAIWPPNRVTGDPLTRRVLGDMGYSNPFEDASNTE